MKCPKCNGIPLPSKKISNLILVRRFCKFCNGKKDLDWVDVITGVDESFIMEAFRESNIYHKLYKL